MKAATQEFGASSTASTSKTTCTKPHPCASKSTTAAETLHAAESKTSKGTEPHPTLAYHDEDEADPSEGDEVLVDPSTLSEDERALILYKALSGAHDANDDDSHHLETSGGLRSPSVLRDVFRREASGAAVKVAHAGERERQQAYFLSPSSSSLTEASRSKQSVEGRNVKRKGGEGRDQAPC